MRVILNYLVAAESHRTGVGHYTAEMYRCVLQQAGDDVIDTFPGPKGQRALAAWMRFRRPRVPSSGSAPRGSSSVHRTIRRHLFHGVRALGRAARHILFRQICRWKRYDLYHEPNFLPLPCDCPTVATLHDLSPLLHPEWHPGERIAQFEKQFRRGLAQCIHFFTVSEFVRREVIQQFGLSPSRVTRTYNGIRPLFTPLPSSEVAVTLRRLDLPPRYLLYVGTIEPRKNIMTLLRAYCALPERIRSRWPLLLVGSWGWNAGDVADFLESGARQRGVLYRPYVPEDCLAALYNGARALVYPSHYEGFGLPPVEMLACGGAVLASNAGALVETVGRQAHLIEPLDRDGWRQAMQRVIEDDDWRQELRQGAVESVRPFTWEQCAADTLGVYRRLSGKKKSEKQPLAA
ncbi:MAG: glycosyltransferase family 4 protein [Gemmataceae bacterium]